jgi:hypothetical protein
VNGAFLHKADDLVLHGDGVVDVVVKLHLELVLQLSVLLQEFLVFDGFSEVMVILSEEVDLAVGSPRVEAVTHWVLRPNADVLAATEEEKSVDFLVETLPVKDVRQPGETVGHVEEGQGNLPRPEEGVDEEHIPREGHQTVVHAVGVLEVDDGVFDVVARVHQQLTLSVEFNGLGWFVDFVGTLEVLLGSLRKLRSGSVDDFVQVVHLTEGSLRVGSDNAALG